MLARVNEAMAARGLSRPVLVGGGAVEFYSGSEVNTGDFDLTTSAQPELEEELQKLGFVRPSGAGKSTRGWVHPELGFGFEVVGNTPMGDTPDEVRVRLVHPVADEPGIRMLSIEDMIADRMGQYASGTARDMLAQAKQLLPLVKEADRNYLEKRIRTETLGEYGVKDLED
jgi:hypothetical protein